MQEDIDIEYKGISIDRALLLAAEYCIYIFAIFLYTDKGEAFRSIGLYVPPVLLAVRSYLTRRLPFDWKNPVFILVAALCISGVIASIFAPSPYESFRWFKKTYLKLFLLFVVVSLVFSERLLLARLVRLFNILVILFIGMTFYDYAFKAIQPDGSINFGGTIRKFCLPMEVLIPFLPLTIISVNKRSMKIFWSFILLLGIIATLLTGARGAWISIAVSLSLWTILYIRLTGKRISIFIPYLIVGFVFILLILSIIPSSHIMSRIKQGFDISQRTTLTWGPALYNYNKLSLPHKLIGNGLDKKTYYQDYSIWYKERYGDYPAIESIYPPHNFYLYTLYKQGIVGLMLLLILIYVCVKGVMLKMKAEDDIQRKLLGVSILSVFIGAFIVHSMVEDPFFISIFTWLLCIIGAYTSDNPLSRPRNIS